MKTISMLTARHGRHSDTAGHASPPLVPERRLWSREAWSRLAAEIVGMARGGGQTSLGFETEWSGNARWARNRINTSGDVRNNTLEVGRAIRGASIGMTLNELHPQALGEAMQYVEQMLGRYRPEAMEPHIEPPFRTEDYLKPHLWFESTYNVDGTRRATEVRHATDSAEQAGMVSAGYLEVKAAGRAVYKPWQQMDLYYPYTEAQYSVTVRAPDGKGSGWAGVNWNDWTRVDMAKLSAIALDKCVKSRNPVAVEPGRWTTILEPQAVFDLFLLIVLNLGWEKALEGEGPFSSGSDPLVQAVLGLPGASKIGQRLLDERISLGADPMDPDLGFVPFDRSGEPYQPATWFDHGVLTHLSYTRRFAITHRLGNLGLLNSLVFRVTVDGPTTPVEEMVATTKRGLLVTRFTNVALLDPKSLLSTGYTRDGVWLVENGKISKPVKNFRFVESPLFAFNQVEQIGIPQRVFYPGSAAVVPAMKVNDFSFPSLSDAI